MLSFSIVIPCRNEEKYIKKCINSILIQNYPKDKIEILVCDGLSSDDTVEIIENLGTKHPNVNLFHNKEQTTPFALNLGIEKSNNEVVIILGAHSELDVNYMLNCDLEFQNNHNASCIGGVLENVYENKQSEIIGKAMSSPFGVGNAHFRTGEKSGFVDTVAFGAYKREVFDEVGLFDVELARNQDDEFNYRITVKGHKIYLSNMLKVKYYVRSSFKNLIIQYYQYGYWKVFVNKKHRVITSIRQLVPFVFVLFLFSLPVWLVINVQLVYFVVLALYFTIATVYAIRKSSKSHEIPKVVTIFFLLHTSYGMGYVEGIINFFIFFLKPRLSSKKNSR